MTRHDKDPHVSIPPEKATKTILATRKNTHTEMKWKHENVNIFYKVLEEHGFYGDSKEYYFSGL